MAKLTILSGGAHTGKSSYLYDRLGEHMARGEHAFLLVPEQATYRSEQQLCALFGGLIGVEVYSFERLCQRLIERYGQTLPYLSDQGRAMVLRRAALKKRSALSLFSRTSQLRGFAASMDARIGRFKQSCITPDDLSAAADKLPSDSLLSQKLQDFSVLYRESEAFLSARYLTSNDLMTVAREWIPSSWLTGCHVYVDDFSRPREQAFRLLLDLLATAKSLTVTLRGSEDPSLSDLFLPDRMIHDRLIEAAASMGISVTERAMTKLSALPDSALLHLERNLFSARPVPYRGKTDAVTVTGIKDRVTEVALVSDRILELVRQGLRFSDIALVASDLAAYGPLVRRAFERRSIPLFYDATRPVSGLGPTDFVLCAARCASNGFPVADVLRLVKSGYAGVGQDEAEIFENYLLRYGIYGSELDKPFSFGEVPPEAEQVRAHIMDTLLPLKDALSDKTASGKVRALWDYLLKNRLREQLEAEADALQKAGHASDAQLYAQLFNTVTALFDQLYTVMGDTELTQREFPALLEEGLSGFSVGIVPGQEDRVVLGDLVRTRLAPIDTLFVLGCNEGLFPPAHTDDDLINDAELETLKGLGLPVWGGTENESRADRLALYAMLSKARRRICFSYAFSADGSELSVAPLLNTVSALYPDNEPQSALSMQTEWPMSDAVGFAALAEMIADYRRDGYVSPKLPVYLAYYRSHPDYAAVTGELLDGTAGSTSPAPFGKKVAQQLYGRDPLMSASRLELFARCPFAQYLRYGLRAEERKTSEEKASDAGTFLHDALDAFVKAVEQRNLNWHTITEAEVDAVLDAILPPLLVAHNDGIFSRDPRLKESLFLRLRLVKLCAHSIVKQLSAGRYRVAATEMSFGMDDAFEPIALTLPDGSRVRIYGKIDRVDQTPDGKLIRIIDYKMGKDRRFDPSKLLSGESLQLPLYFSAAKALGGACAGMYYMPLTIDPPEEGQTPEHKLFGLTASDEDSICAAECDLGQKSELIHDLKRNKDGQITGAACSRERLQEIIDAAQRIAARQASGILDGNADLYPTESACKWCPYASVCRFDKQTGCKNRYVRKVALDDLLTGKEDLP